MKVALALLSLAFTACASTASFSGNTASTNNASGSAEGEVRVPAQAMDREEYYLWMLDNSTAVRLNQGVKYRELDKICNPSNEKQGSDIDMYYASLSQLTYQTPNALQIQRKYGLQKHSIESARELQKLMENLGRACQAKNFLIARQTMLQVANWLGIKDLPQ